MPRFLGIDYGEQRIGLAISDSDGRLAVGRETLSNEGMRAAAEAIHTIIKQENISLMVLGLPLTLSGEKGQRAKRSEQFSHLLEQLSQKPVVLEDERFSSKLADQMVSFGSRDERAAVLILQSYLDRKA